MKCCQDELKKILVLYISSCNKMADALKNKSKSGFKTDSSEII